MRESPRRPWLPLTLGILGLFLLIASEAGYLTSIENTFHYVLDPLQRLFSGVTQVSGNLFETVREVRELRTQVDELQEQVDALTFENVSLRDYRAEVQSLRALLAFTDEFSISGYLGADVVSREACTTFPCGEVIGEEPNPYLHYVTINVGAQQGIEVGMPVVSGGAGLVGRIAQVAPRTAKVQLLTDRESAITAILQTSRATGLVVGQPDGTLSMEYIPQEMGIGVGNGEDDQEENASAGDIVLTSGLGGFMPKGLVIGQVTEIQQMDYELFQTAIVRPAVDFSRLELVLVITSFEQIPLEEEPEPVLEAP
ncbi:MAG: rod shape-determining protein MreC [Chloroflexi bacterium]|nr:rod shape-determining protein MreC [Chloroflexota bacterium]